MAGIHITDIEAAINWWRERSPSPDNISACAEVRALAEVYALMVYHHEPECDERSMPAKARDAWLGWYDTTPDAPCIAICSTSQGDDWCKGCGRSFDEVQHWPVMSPGEKRATWRRITLDGTAWRFNRYAERAREGAPVAVAANSVAEAEAAAAPALALDVPAATPVLDAPTDTSATAAVVAGGVAVRAAAPAQPVAPVSTAAPEPLPEPSPEAVPELTPVPLTAAVEVLDIAEPAAPVAPVEVADELVDAVIAPATTDTPGSSALVLLTPAGRARKGLRAWWSRWVMRRRAS